MLDRIPVLFPAALGSASQASGARVQGFVRNLAFLKAAFNPTYEVFAVRQLNDTDVEARWSMSFDVVPILDSPLGSFWRPRMEFTGTSIYGTNPETGLVERHIDGWDNLDVSDYFSAPAFVDVLSQIFSLEQTPRLEGPSFTLLKCAPLMGVTSTYF